TLSSSAPSLTLNCSAGAGAAAGALDPTVPLSVGVIATMPVSRLMPVIVPVLPCCCCWASAEPHEPQKAIVATGVMVLAVFIGLLLVSRSWHKAPRQDLVPEAAECITALRLTRRSSARGFRVIFASPQPAPQFSCYGLALVKSRMSHEQIR